VASRRLALLFCAIGFPACDRDAPATSGAPTTPPGADGAWASLPAMRVPRQEVGVAEVAGRLYVCGGFNAAGATVATVESYDVATGEWTTLAPMPVALNHAAAASFGGRVYVFGGDSPTRTENVTLEFDPASNAWALRARMPTARNAAVALPFGDRIYVIGGTPGGRDVEAYHPSSDSWTRLAPMPTARNHLAGAVVAGRLYVVGGRPPFTLSTLEVYDVATDSWTTRAPMPTGRSGHAAAAVRGCLYVMGGEGNGARPDGVFPHNEGYDPRRDAWEAFAPMPTPRHGIGAVAALGRISVPGGASVQGVGVSAAHEAFTPPSARSCE
jgi:N-acetylneuraminic acid mutarotase